jgi:hypothetical protein
MNLNAVRGDTFTLPIQIKNNGIPMDISGWTFFFTMKNKINDSDANAVLKRDIVIHVDANQGRTQLVLSATDTANFVGSYVYDFQFRDINGNVGTFLLGTMNFVKDVSRRIA